MTLNDTKWCESGEVSKNWLPWQTVSRRVIGTIVAPSTVSNRVTGVPRDWTIFNSHFGSVVSKLRVGTCGFKWLAIDINVCCGWRILAVIYIYIFYIYIYIYMDQTCCLKHRAVANLPSNIICMYIHDGPGTQWKSTRSWYWRRLGMTSVFGQKKYRTLIRTSYI